MFNYIQGNFLTNKKSKYIYKVSTQGHAAHGNAFYITQT